MVENSDTAKKVILIVEDDTDLRQALVRALKDAGHIVHEASNGDEGIVAIKQQLPDLMLLDLLMPLMSGQEMMHAVEELPGGADIPVIVLTNIGLGDKEVKQISRNRPTWYLVKSDVSLKDILDKINSLFQAKK